MKMPPSTVPTSELPANSALMMMPISVFENPTSIMKGVNSLLAKASPILNSSTTAISAWALGVLKSSFSGSITDSASVRGR